MDAKAVVLCYNQPDLTRAMYAQLGDDMIMVDNGSTVHQPLLKCRTFKYMSNRYFSGGWNRAMRELQDTDWVWMLNSDVQGVTPAMMYRLIEEADYLGADVISPSFNSPHPHMQPQLKGTRFVRWIDWCCPVVKMEAWLKVGEFDAERLPGYGSDLDWC